MVEHADLIEKGIGRIEGTYTFSDVQRICNVPRSHLARWTAAGIITPEHGGGDGSGSHRLYSFFNLLEIRIAFEIKGRGADDDVDAVLSELRWFRSEPKVVNGKRLKALYQFSDVDATDLNLLRWQRFMNPATRTGDCGLLVVGIGGAISLDRRSLTKSIHQTNFFDEVNQLERYLRGPSRYPNINIDLSSTPVSHVMVDVLRILTHIEKETGDHIA